MLPDKKSFVVVINSLEDKKKLELLNRSLNKRIKQEVKKSTKQLKMIQEEQLKTTKLSSIATLAAGITHEINTPLTYMKGNLEMLQYDIDSLDDENQKQNMTADTNRVLDGMNRISNIVKAMREVSQSTSELKKNENIYSTLVTALTIVYNRSKQLSKIYINNRLFDINHDKNKLVFNANIQKQRVEQVWIVLVNNALDELTKIENYDDRRIDIDIKDENDFIVISCKDNAGGIGETMLEKIFEPFESSKEQSGIGIGLNIAKQIVNDQDGEIIAYNEAKGAVFEVKIPKKEKSENSIHR